jgi:MFS transporter, PPP family, 3-phenylpropionic acid transporter
MFHAKMESGKFCGKATTLRTQALFTDNHSSKDHWVARWMYFFFFTGVGTFLMFLNVYYRSIGLSGTQIGLINTLGPAVGIFSATFWGMLRDRTGKMRQIFMLTVFGAICMVLIFLQVRVFIWILPVVALFSLFNSPILPLIDSHTLRLLGARGGRYGRYRVWGTIGFTLASLVIGFVYERTGLHTMFYVYPAILFILFLIGSLLPNQPVRTDHPVGHGVWQMVRKPDWRIFAISVYLLGMAANGAIAFVSVKIVGMGGSTSLVGLSWTTTAILEFPLMFFSEVILRRIGAVRLLIIAFIGYALRIFLYGIMPVPGWAPFVNFLHGISFVPWTLGTVAYVNERSPEHLKATSQGLLASVLNLSNLSGALLAGWLYDQIGPVNVFLVMSGICLIGLAVFTIGRLVIRRSTGVKEEG